MIVANLILKSYQPVEEKWLETKYYSVENLHDTIFIWTMEENF